jgi:cupin 2 domain-containing protein
VDPETGKAGTAVQLKLGNLFAALPTQLSAEHFETLAAASGFRIDRIVTYGHSSPESDWYDQQDNEWCLLLRGAARLVFEAGEEVELAPGDWLDIPAHTRHRVSWTAPGVETIWLAVHYGG